MAQESVGPLNPCPQEFAGESLPRILKRMFHATRPKFFPASVLPVVVGTAWGAYASGAMDYGIFLIALLATVLVHAASNVLNDVGDDSGGTDRINEQRIYPYTGGSRFIQLGIISRSKMARFGTLLLVVAALLGFLLYLERGPGVLFFGLAGIVLGVLYSLGPVRLSAIGIGEATIAVAFGVLPVVGAAWLQGAPVEAALILLSIPVSVWVCAILLINEVPDIGADGATGKNTLPVRLGLPSTAILYIALQLVAAVVIVFLTLQGVLPLLAPVVPLGLIVLAWRASVAIRTGIADRGAMTQAIEATLAIHTLGCIWLTGCVVYKIAF